MTTASHESPGSIQQPLDWSLRVLVPEMWAFLAITVIWLSVLVTAVVGPDIVSTTVAGDHTTVPAAVAVAFFAFFATWVVARYGFRRERTPD